jgi:hypothetical protein
MNESDGLPFKAIGWNGLSFRVPAGWEIGKMGARYLLFEEESGPKLEIKWRKVGRNFSLEAQLNRFSEARGKKSGAAVRKLPIPEEWQKSLEGFYSLGFSWQEETLGGTGLILHCKSCRNAALIQFFTGSSDETFDVSKRVLKSFRDHPKDGRVIWCVFDIRAVIPESLRMETYQFSAGAYRLNFVSPGQRITLHRWGPAAFLLEKQNIFELTGKQLKMDSRIFRPARVNGCDALKWEAAPSGTWLDRIRYGNPFRWIRVWHLEAKNRILGVVAEGKRSLDARMLDRICSRYDSL